MKNIYKLCLLATLFLLTPHVVCAATLYIEGPQNVVVQKSFTLTIKMSADKSINVVEGYMRIPSSLEVVSVDDTSSLFSFWQTRPVFDANQGLVRFVGGLPYPGFIGNGGLVAHVQLKPKNNTAATINFTSDSRVLLNDGEGTVDQLSTKGYTLRFVSDTKTPQPPGKPAEQPSELNPIQQTDTIPPEIIEFEVAQSETIFEGRAFVGFLAKDDSSGIDYYEIAEIPVGKQVVSDITPKDSDWKKASSPYLLENQKERTAIFLKAVDKAGNVSIKHVVFEPSIKQTPTSYIPIVTVVSISILFIVFTLIRYLYLLHKVKTKV